MIRTSIGGARRRRSPCSSSASSSGRRRSASSPSPASTTRRRAAVQLALAQNLRRPAPAPTSIPSHRTRAQTRDAYGTGPDRDRPLQHQRLSRPRTCRCSLPGFIFNFVDRGLLIGVRRWSAIGGGGRRLRRARRGWSCCSRCGFASATISASRSSYHYDWALLDLRLRRRTASLILAGLADRRLVPAARRPRRRGGPAEAPAGGLEQG